MRDHRWVLSIHTVADHGGVAVRAVCCRHPRGGAGDTTVTATPGVVFVQRGCFVRECNGATQTLDAAMAYLKLPGREERFAHPHSGGDDCLVIDFGESMFAELFDPGAATTDVVPIDARLAVGARLMRTVEPDARVEVALSLVHGVAFRLRGRVRPARVSRGARDLVMEARQALTEDPTLTLSQLSGRLSASPHHLSRMFSAVTGQSMSTHRTQLRIGLALDRLLDGEGNVARLAADLGFADHAHLTRTLRHHTGLTPSQVRAGFSPRRRAAAVRPGVPVGA